MSLVQKETGVSLRNPNLCEPRTKVNGGIAQASHKSHASLTQKKLTTSLCNLNLHKPHTKRNEGIALQSKSNKASRKRKAMVSICNQTTNNIHLQLVLTSQPPTQCYSRQPNRTSAPSLLKLNTSYTKNTHKSSLKTSPILQNGGGILLKTNFKSNFLQNLHHNPVNNASNHLGNRVL